MNQLPKPNNLLSPNKVSLYLFVIGVLGLSISWFLMNDVSKNYISSLICQSKHVNLTIDPNQAPRGLVNLLGGETYSIMLEATYTKTSSSDRFRFQQSDKIDQIIIDGEYVNLIDFEQDGYFILSSDLNGPDYQELIYIGSFFIDQDCYCKIEFPNLSTRRLDSLSLKLTRGSFDKGVQKYQILSDISFILVGCVILSFFIPILHAGVKPDIGRDDREFRRKRMEKLEKDKNIYLKKNNIYNLNKSIEKSYVPDKKEEDYFPW